MENMSSEDERGSYWDNRSAQVKHYKKHQMSEV